MDNRLLKVFALLVLVAPCAVAQPLLLAAERGAGEIFASSFEFGEQPNPDACALVVDQNITVATTWVNSTLACDYLVDGAIRVSGGTLTVSPGTGVRFTADSYLLFDDGGALQAAGAPGQRISFAGKNVTNGFAGGIYFASGAGQSVIEHTDFASLGRDQIGSQLIGGALGGSGGGGGLTLTDSTVSGSATSGAALQDIDVLAFGNNSFSGNLGFALHIRAADLHLLDDASDYAGQTVPNGMPYVALEGSVADDGIPGAALWKRLNAPYFVPSGFTISGAEISLQAGVEFVFAADVGARIDNNGSLTAIGTSSQPIRFTGEQSLAGYWTGIEFSGSDSVNNEFDHVEVRYAGGVGSTFGSVALNEGSRLSLTNSTVADSATWGVCVGFISFVDLGPGNAFSNNPSGDVVYDCK